MVSARFANERETDGFSIYSRQSTASNNLETEESSNLPRVVIKRRENKHNNKLELLTKWVPLKHRKPFAFFLLLFLNTFVGFLPVVTNRHGHQTMVYASMLSLFQAFIPPFILVCLGTILENRMEKFPTIREIIILIVSGSSYYGVFTFTFYCIALKKGAVHTMVYEQAILISILFYGHAFKIEKPLVAYSLKCWMLIIGSISTIVMSVVYIFRVHAMVANFDVLQPENIFTLLFSIFALIVVPLIENLEVIFFIYFPNFVIDGGALKLETTLNFGRRPTMIVEI
ncbi:hypothetical protein RF11_15422 [Thelohanellus kitauei]|uniref:Uncharacterized protein n=1 Tax=Thelohanellus kitauei TaxID=669202 RepID=A0A0C2J9H7_THEKT|nr:hypothetical protein RF11_15422 [Thelohanellus kitauei]